MSERKATAKKLTARQYLEQLQELDNNINQNLERLEEMKHSAAGVRGIDYAAERVQSSCVGNKLCNDVTRYMSLDVEINEEIDRFVDAKNQIIAEIRGLHVKNYIQVLFKVYVQFKSLKVSAAEMKMSYQYVRILHKNALAAFEDMYDNLHYLT